MYQTPILKNFVYKNTNINYSDSGKGTVVVLLHGYLENLSMWDFFYPTFLNKYRIVTIDLLGHGGSDCLGYVHAMEDQAAMVFAVLKNLKIKKAVFIGHSMGGYVALAFAEMFPDFLKALVLLNSTSQADSQEKKDNRDRAIQVVKKNYVNFVRLSISNLFGIENLNLFADAIEKVKIEALKTPLQGIIAAQEGMKIRKDREVLLHLTQFPKLLVLGKNDNVLSFETTSQQTKNTTVTLSVFSGGHMSHIENRDELLTVLLGFFKEIRL